MAVDLLRAHDPLPGKLSKTLRLLAWAYLEQQQIQPALSAVDMAIAEEGSVLARKMKLEILLKALGTGAEDQSTICAGQEKGKEKKKREEVKYGKRKREKMRNERKKRSRWEEVGNNKYLYIYIIYIYVCVCVDERFSRLIDLYFSQYVA